MPDFLFMALSELSIVPFEARYRFQGSLACIGSRATYFFMMERIRTHLYSIGSLASSSKLGALRDAASLTWPENEKEAEESLEWSGNGVIGNKHPIYWLDFKKWEWNRSSGPASYSWQSEGPTWSIPKTVSLRVNQPTNQELWTRISVCKDLEPPALNPSFFFQCFQSRAKLPAFLLAHGEDMQSRQQLTCIPLRSPPPPGEKVLVWKERYS